MMLVFARIYYYFSNAQDIMAFTMDGSGLLFPSTVESNQVLVLNHEAVQENHAPRGHETLPKVEDAPTEQDSQSYPKPLKCSDIDSMPKVQSRQAINKCVPSHPFEQSIHSLGDIVSGSIVREGCWERGIVRSIVNHFGFHNPPSQ